jgi:hypothetical protein
MKAKTNMSATTQAARSRAEINRSNSRMSTGPRTASGKQRVKFNALKHGLRAKTIVLPGEEEAFRARREAWTIALKPSDEADRFLLDRAVAVSLKLERVGRAVEVRRSALSHADADRLAAQAEEVVGLGRRLFFDPVGPLCLYPHAAPPADGEPQRVSYSGDPQDPDDPACIVVRIEALTLGCAWLLDRWGELRDILEAGRSWQPQDRFKAIRMLGRQPLDAVDDMRVMSIYLDSWVMEPDDQHEFTDVMIELTPTERRVCMDRLNARDPQGKMVPKSPEAARADLLALITAEEERLEAVLAGHLEREEAEWQAVLAFDDSTWGERLRRYEASNDRLLLRIIATLRKRHREADGTTRSRGRAFARVDSASGRRASARADSASGGRAPARAEAPPQESTDSPTGRAEEAAPEPVDSPGGCDAVHDDIDHLPGGRTSTAAEARPQETAIKDEWDVRELTEAEIHARVARIAEVLGFSPAAPAANLRNEVPVEEPGPSPAGTEPLPAGNPDRGSAGLTEVADGGVEVPASIDQGPSTPTNESGRTAASPRWLPAAVLALFAPLFFLAGLPAASAWSPIEPTAAKPDSLAGRILAPSSSDTPIPARWLCSSRAPDEPVAGVPERESMSSGPGAMPSSFPTALHQNRDNGDNG